MLGNLLVTYSPGLATSVDEQIVRDIVTATEPVVPGVRKHC
jgi:hypothetical protein